MTTILKNPPLKDSQRFDLLREVGLEKIEDLGHDFWTDYNVHDPGVTFLEMVCYAITDLGYRTGYDMKDLLTTSNKGVPENKSNFHTALNIFPNCPVTFKDLRKCIIDIKGVRNAWISKHLSIQYCLDGQNQKLKDECDPTEPLDLLCEPLNGLFDILLEFEDNIEEDRIVILGELVWDEPNGSFINPANKGLLFHAYYDFTLKNVSVYADTEGDATLNLFRKEEDGTWLKIDTVTKKIRKANQKFKLDLEFDIAGGYDYRLEGVSDSVKLFKNDNPNFPYKIDHLVDLQSGVGGAKYYFFYDLELSYGLSDSEMETINGALPDPSTGGSMNANNQGLRFSISQDVFLSSVDIFPFSIGTLTVCLFDKNDVLVQFKHVEIDTVNTVQLLEIGWNIPKDDDYSIKASGVQLSFENIPNFNANPIDIDGVVAITSGIASTGTLNNQFHFFYNWSIGFSPSHLPKSRRTREDVRLDVRNKLHEVRNLCEDFIKIRELKFEEIGVCADIEVESGVNVEETLAKIYYELEKHVAPPVNFYTLQELLDKGKTTDEIFEGPALEHGFIDHEEFCERERRCFFRTSDIIQIIMDIPGVIAVKEISLLSLIEITDEVQPTITDRVETIDGIKYIVKQEPWILELADLQRFSPDFNPKRSKIIFYKNDLPYMANFSKAIEIFEDIRATHIRPKLKGHERDIPVPIGEFKDLEEYYPAQNGLPQNYRLGIYKVPESDTDLRKAQARQLKAYLLFMEQYLANYLSQLNHVNDLFSWKKEAAIHSYYTQRIAGIADIEDVYFDYENLLGELEDIIESEDEAIVRKNRFLDHLMGRFSESFAKYELLLPGIIDDAGTHLIEDKQDFLADYPLISSARGKSFNYRYPKVLENITGFQRRVYRLLGIRPVERRNFSGQRFKIEPIIVIEDGIPVDKFQFVLYSDKNLGQILFTSISCENRSEICTLLDSSLHLGANRENWVDEDGQWRLHQTCEADGDEIGSLINNDQDLLEEVIAYFDAIANAEGFHIIEHILLRKRTLEDPFLKIEIPDEDDCECPCVKDPYSFRASVILPSWAGRFRHIRFRQYIEDVLREEASAHVYLKICWIDHCEMMEFEECHDKWLSSLSEMNECYKGQMPLESVEDLPVLEKIKMKNYTEVLEKLLAKLQNMNNIFPIARLHDCETVSGDEPQISLNNTSLGSL